MPRPLSILLAIFLLGASTAGACSSFAIYSDRIWYGMNFDYGPTDIGLSLGHSGETTVFYATFTGGGHIAEMNSRGLFADLQILDYNTPQAFARAPDSIEIHTLYDEPILSRGTVAEVLDYIGSRVLTNSWGLSSHALFADREGSAAVIEPFANYTGITQNTGPFLVMTNFPVHDFAGRSYEQVSGTGAARYRTAYEYLSSHRAAFSRDDAFEVLRRVAQSSGAYPTRVSMVFDPVNLEVFVCFERDFSRIVKVSLRNETIETFSGFASHSVQRLTSTVWASQLTAQLSGSASQPVLLASPVDVTAVAGGRVEFNAVATGTGLTYRWIRNGVELGGATQSTLVMSRVTANDAGSYSVVVGNPWGNATSAPARLAIGPTLTAHPAGRTVAPGGAVTLAAGATSSEPVSFAWWRNGTLLPGQTGSSLTLASVSAADAGDYTVTAGNSLGMVTSRTARLIVAAPVPGRLCNMSIRAGAGFNGQPLIVGVVAAGKKQILLRGVGPSLRSLFGVPDALSDPRMDVFQNTATGSVVVASNDDWDRLAADAAVFGTLFGKVGAFPLPSGGRDSAVTLNVDGGATIHVNPANEEPGEVLVEAYECTDADPVQFVNLSCRNVVGARNRSFIAGFGISGNTPQRVMIRGAGPALASTFGLPGAFSDPRIELHGGDGVLASNDDWEDEPGAAAAADTVRAFPFRPGSKDSCLVVTLPPGSYTAVLTGPGWNEGEALLEIYLLPSD